jgi:hypothetical protein
VRETLRLPIEPARLALVLALLVSLHGGDPNPTHIVFWIAIGTVLAISARWPVGLAAILVLFVGAVALRLAWSDRLGSDVLNVTKAAYQSSSPPGAPFPYGPLAILLYLPFHQAAFVLELLSGFIVAAILAFQGRLVGLAVYAAAPIVVSLAVDGSNDTTLGLLILLSFMTAKRWPLVAGFLLASAVAFKLSALAFAPGFFAWAGLRATIMFAAGSVITWAPVLATWGIGSFLESATRANEMHTSAKWSFGVLVKELAGRQIELLDTLRFAAGGLVALAGLRFRRSMDGVIVVGCAVYLVTLYGGNWASFAYFGGIAAIVCWRLDDWLGFESRSLIDQLRGLRRPRPRSGADPEAEPQTEGAPA